MREIDTILRHWESDTASGRNCVIGESDCSSWLLQAWTPWMKPWQPLIYHVPAPWGIDHLCEEPLCPFTIVHCGQRLPRCESTVPLFYCNLGASDVIWLVPKHLPHDRSNSFKCKIKIQEMAHGARPSKIWMQGEIHFERRCHLMDFQKPVPSGVIGLDQLHFFHE